MSGGSGYTDPTFVGRIRLVSIVGCDDSTRFTGDNVKYLLLIYSEPSNDPQPDAEGAEMLAAYNEFTEAVTAEGILVAAEALDGVETATTVRVRNDETLMTDGPFAETKEVLGGFYLIDVPDLDAALKVAARLPGSWHGSVEVRPIFDWTTIER